METSGSNTYIAQQQAKGLQIGQCRGCHRQIGWLKTAANNRPVPVELQERNIISADGSYHRGWETHFAYCSKASEFRRV